MDSRNVCSRDRTKRAGAGPKEIFTIVAGGLGCPGVVPCPRSRLPIAHECFAQGIHEGSQMSTRRHIKVCGFDHDRFGAIRGSAIPGQKQTYWAGLIMPKIRHAESYKLLAVRN